jgi:hypothetical protein
VGLARSGVLGGGGFATGRRAPPAAADSRCIVARAREVRNWCGPAELRSSQLPFERYTPRHLNYRVRRYRRPARVSPPFTGLGRSGPPAALEADARLASAKAYCGNCDGITAGGLPIAITMSL